MERISKENYYLDIAETVLERATCLRRVYGAIIVKNDEIISTGYNGAPRGRKNCVDMGFCTREAMQVPRGQRYELCRSVHAEANAIISASRRDMVGSTLYLVGRDGQTGALQPMQALLDAPASVSAARLTGCKNFFPLTKDGCVDGWPLQLPARRDGAAIVAVPQTALELGGSGTPFRILRIIPDAGHAILLPQPEGAAEGSPVLRAECDAAGTYAAGQTLPVSFREEKLLFF